MSIEIRQIRKYKYKTQDPLGIDHVQAIPSRAYFEDGTKFPVEFRTLTLAEAYTGCNRGAILRSIYKQVFVKTRRGNLKFELIK